MIRVLHVTSTPLVTGGTENLLLQVSRQHDPAEFEVHFCNLFFPQSAFSEAVVAGGWPVYSIGIARARSVVPTIVRLRQLIDRLRPDIVNTHMVHSTIATYLSLCGRNSPERITTRHYSQRQLKNNAIRRLDTLATRSASRVIAVSGAIRDEAVDMGVSANRADTVPNGIDLAVFDQSTGVDPVPWPVHWMQDPILISVGNLFGYKGHVTLLRVVAEVKRACPRIRLVIVGEGPERVSLERLIVSLGLSGHVVLAGRRTDVPLLLRLATACVHTPTSEAFGIAVIEAMAAKLPVIATAVGGLPEVIEDGVTGLLVPEHDLQALSLAIQTLVADSDLRARMGKAGRERVERLFTIERVARRTEAAWTLALRH